MKKCNACKYHLNQDTGYSNYTVEGRDIYCLLEQNPDLPVDLWYGDEPKLDFAETCASFQPGDGVYVDVDHDDGDLENYSDDPEIKTLLKKFEA